MTGIDFGRCAKFSIVYTRHLSAYPRSHIAAHASFSAHGKIWSQLISCRHTKLHCTTLHLVRHVCIIAHDAVYGISVWLLHLLVLGTSFDSIQYS